MFCDSPRLCAIGGEASVLQPGDGAKVVAAAIAVSPLGTAVGIVENLAAGNVLGAAAELSPTKKIDAARDLLKANKAQGKAGEAITRSNLGDKVAGEQVTFKTSDGTKTRTDFVTKDKGVVETKTGDATLSTGQEKLKADIDAGRSVTPVGRNAANAGLKPGEPTKMTSCTVDRPC